MSLKFLATHPPSSYGDRQVCWQGGEAEGGESFMHWRQAVPIDAAVVASWEVEVAAAGGRYLCLFHAMADTVWGASSMSQGPFTGSALGR